KRTLFYIVLVIVTICILVGSLKGYPAAWSIWGIPTMTPHFADVRNLTGGAESISMGYDPLYFNPNDPWGRPMNQPRLVQHIVSFLNINQHDTTFIGTLFIILFFVGVFLPLKEINNVTALMLGIVIFSPAVVLGIERGNHDLFIFFLVALALFMSNAPMISMIILLFASFVKLFPVFAIAYFFKFTKKTQVIVFLTFITSFATYVFFNYSDLPQIFESTQKGHDVLAYGALAIRSSSIVSYIPLAAIVISSLVFCVNAINASGFTPGDTRYIDNFRAGAGIYVGTFFLGNNWCYRLMFLIFTIPQLLSWRNDAGRRVVSLTTLICIIVSCWSLWSFSLPVNTDPPPASVLLKTIDETANWVLFASFLYLLVSTTPLFLQKGVLRAALSKIALTHR
ncbi:MAG TPA: hypothetical protein VH815_00680, partial [Acidobacteriota bacterium]